MSRSRDRRRKGGAVVGVALVVGVILGVSGCDGGGGDGTVRPSAGAPERSVNPPDSGEAARSLPADATRTGDAEATRTGNAEATRTGNAEATRTGDVEATRTVGAEPTRTGDAEATRTGGAEPSREPEAAGTTARTPTSTAEPGGTAPTGTPAETTTTRAPTSAVVAAPGTTPTATTTPAATTLPTPSASAVAVSESSASDDLLGWLLAIMLIGVMVVGGLLMYRSQRKSTWDADARALEAETRTVSATRLPPVLATTTTGARGLAWPPVRAALTDLVTRWGALAERAPGEPRRLWSLQLGGLLGDLITAVDAENQALGAGQDWMLLRPRVTEAEQALAAALASQPQPGDPQPV